MLPTKFRFIWPSGFGEDLKKLANEKQELPVVAMFVNRSGQNEQSLERTFHSDGKSSHCLRQGELKRLKLFVDFIH
jgi:hypothetical protein